MDLTLCIAEPSLKNSKNIEIILKLILKNLEKMKDYKSFLIDKNYWAMKDIVFVIMISKNLIQQALKMIKHLMLRRKHLNLNIEEHWIKLKIIKEETKEW